MIYLRSVRIEHVWEHAGIDWKSASGVAGPKQTPVWKVATPVRDAEANVDDSRFYRSIDDECDDDPKRSSLFVMLNKLRYAVCNDNYQDVIKESNIQVKEAHKFDYRNKYHKIWELKYKNKDRIYFFTHCDSNNKYAKLLIPTLFHHKKDQTTPKSVNEYCKSVMKPFLDPNPEVVVIKE